MISNSDTAFNAFPAAKSPKSVVGGCPSSSSGSLSSGSTGLDGCPSGVLTTSSTPLSASQLNLHHHPADPLGRPGGGGLCTGNLGTLLPLDDEALSFSPKLCLELLPKLSDDQIKFEIEYWSSINNTDTLDSETFTTKLNAELATRTANDFTVLFTQSSNVISSLSHAVKEAEDTLKRFQSLLENPPTTAPTALATVNSPTFSDEVCLVHEGVNFPDFTVEELLKHMKIDEQRSYGRRTAYFGPVPYGAVQK